MPSASARFVKSRLRVHRIPPRVRDVRTPLCGVDGGSSRFDLPDGTSEIFFAEGLDSQMSDLPVEQDQHVGGIRLGSVRARSLDFTRARCTTRRWMPPNSGEIGAKGIRELAPIAIAPREISAAPDPHPWTAFQLCSSLANDGRFR